MKKFLKTLAIVLVACITTLSAVFLVGCGMDDSKSGSLLGGKEDTKEGATVLTANQALSVFTMAEKKLMYDDKSINNLEIDVKIRQPFIGSEKNHHVKMGEYETGEWAYLYTEDDLPDYYCLGYDKIEVSGTGDEETRNRTVRVYESQQFDNKGNVIDGSTAKITDRNGYRPCVYLSDKAVIGIIGLISPNFDTGSLIISGSVNEDGNFNVSIYFNKDTKHCYINAEITKEYKYVKYNYCEISAELKAVFIENVRTSYEMNFSYGTVDMSKIKQKIQIAEDFANASV